MDLLKYLKPMKNLPERFSNLAFWRGVRKLRDGIVNAFEYIDSWGKILENDVAQMKLDIANFQIMSVNEPTAISCQTNFVGRVEIDSKSSSLFLNVYINSSNFSATLENARTVKYGFLTLYCHVVKESGFADVPVKIPAQLFSPAPNIIVAIPTVDFARCDISDVRNVTISSPVSVKNVTLNYFI